MIVSAELLMKLKDALIRQEDLRLKPYYDSEGHLTIGVGRNLDEGISEDEAFYLLDRDVKRTVIECEKFFPFWPELNEARKFVLLNMVFNMGLTRFRTFERMISYLKRSDYNAASNEMLKSKWAAQVKKRAVVLSEMMRLGVFPD